MEIGIIGLGDMGKLYAKTFSKQGYNVNACDLPEKRSQLEQELQGSGVYILNSGKEVSEKSDLIFYSVETEKINDVVRQFGRYTKQRAIVAGQTSVKTPEIEAFEKYLSNDTNIVTCHSLHGPSVNPIGQSLAVIKHRSSDEAYKRAVDTFEKLGSNIIEISNYQEHDKITADTQAVTHLCFESMGTAWKNANILPWNDSSYSSELDNVKALMTLRVHGGKPHVYSGLAMFNPFAIAQIRQYASSVSELLGMSTSNDLEGIQNRIEKAGNLIFNRQEISLRKEVIDDFRMADKKESKSNSHLSLLAMIDSWNALGMNPYDNLICQTPLFKLRLGVAEYLFRDKQLLNESIQTAVQDEKIRKDDLEFNKAVNKWSSIIESKDVRAYNEQFNDNKEFFKEHISEGMKKSNELIKKLAN